MNRCRFTCDAGAFRDECRGDSQSPSFAPTCAHANRKRKPETKKDPPKEVSFVLSSRRRNSGACAISNDAVRPCRGWLQLLLVAVPATALLALVSRHLGPLALFSTGHRYLQGSKKGAVNLSIGSPFVKEFGGQPLEIPRFSGVIYRESPPADASRNPPARGRARPC